MTKTLLILPLLLCSCLLFAQSDSNNVILSSSSLAVVTQQETGKPEKFSIVVDYVEKALQAGSADAISKNFSKKVSLNLLGKGSGIYSLNQAYYIVRSFFEEHRLLGVELNPQGEATNDYFASGSCTILNRGKHETLKIYVSFSRSGNSFLISQLTIF